MDIDFKVTNVYNKNVLEYQIPTKRYIVNSGGSRSSKTYSILQLFAIILMQKKGYKISCYRNLRVDCIDTCGQDFENIMRETGLSTLFVHNIKDAKWTCKSTGSVIYFAGTEKIHKSLGQQNNIIFLNEISEFSMEVFNQLDQRCRDKVFIDYNPSKDFWIEKYRNNPAAIFLHSTYKDNPFLTIGQISKLESYNPFEEGSTYVENSLLMYNGKEVNEKNVPPPNIENIKNGLADRYMYEVYCLGLGSEKPNRIYSGWKECSDAFYESLEFERYFGLDFGISSPSAVVEVCFDGDRTFYIKEVLYKPISEMNMSLVEYLTLRRGVSNKPIIDEDKITVCDSAKKSMVTDLAKGGLTAIPALKGAGSISRTIGVIKSFNIVYTESSQNLRDEYLDYSWKIDRYGLVDDVPQDRQADHLMQATGYIISYLMNYLGIGEV
jgi:phage terminase large subunit